MESIGVLFVCTGNICRSPTAEAVFRHKVLQAGLGTRFHIDSAGTHGYHIGDPPDPRTICTALRRGVDMRDLRARKVDAEDFARFQQIYAMDSGHYDLLSRLIPAVYSSRLKLFVPEEDVADPYYGAIQGFEEVYDVIEKGVEDLLNALKTLHDL
jgi:protein-tyrosine phosphatase